MNRGHAEVSIPVSRVNIPCCIGVGGGAEVMFGLGAGGGGPGLKDVDEGVSACVAGTMSELAKTIATNSRASQRNAATLYLLLQQRMLLVGVIIR